jgi:hypothetical protein
MSTSTEWPGHQARYWWVKKFNTTPYTTFWMIEYLLTKGHISYEDYVKDPKILQKCELKTEIEGTNDFSDLISRPGRCTSFAIQVADILEELPGHKGHYDFRFYNLGHHRVARCMNTGLLIDSASQRGDRYLTGDDWISVNEHRRGKSISDTLKYETYRHESNSWDLVSPANRCAELKLLDRY